MAQSVTQELFGGAITVSMPRNLIDASDLRQVPDTQEVFLYPNSGVSIIIEVLQSVDAQDFADIARIHFDSLAHDNDAEGRRVLDVAQLPGNADFQTPAPTVLAGSQLVRKFNHSSPDEIRILMAVYRVQSHHIDLVMTMNVPMKTEDDTAVDENEWLTAKQAFDVAAQSLQIVDFGLFA